MCMHLILESALNVSLAIKIIAINIVQDCGDSEPSH